MSSNPRIISVAVPVPIRQSFDFLMPQSEGIDLSRVGVGMRVKVPFGNRRLIGVITQIKNQSDYKKGRLKEAIEILDTESVFEEKLWETLLWLANYYLAPIGEVLDMAMPVRLRQGESQSPAPSTSWRLSEKGRSSAIDDLARAPLQLAIVKRFMQNTVLTPADFKNESRSWRQAIGALIDKEWVEEDSRPPRLPKEGSEIGQSSSITVTEVHLNKEQTHAVKKLEEAINEQKFSCNLVHGVTGSGKTEVYFSAIDSVLKQNQQVLLLVPEIGLTPQLIDRIERRFRAPLVIMHSGLNETQRHLAWWFAKSGEAKIILGTRSAVFSSFSDLGLIIVDEEHDGSFKQQDKVRYQARDVAIYRAKQEHIPIILGSATPSLESLVNAQTGRYQMLRIKTRATQVALPTVELLDMNVLPARDGLSPAMVEAIKSTLQKSRQVILFLNRRGYAPVMYCRECGMTTDCHRCDSHLTYHQRVNRLRCHHCGYECAAKTSCPSCKAQDSLRGIGEGTQRVEEALVKLFPSARILRIDRDSTRRKGELEKALGQARDGEADILLGTQLLSKGHDFPHVAMVGVLGADQGLYSVDFRASESLFQQIIQVAGRAGRRDAVGRVFIQTVFPSHPFYQFIKNHDYDSFSQALVQERQQASYPPFAYFALIRAESVHQSKALQFLRLAKSELQRVHSRNEVQIMDAIPAPMEHRAGKYRAQLLISAPKRVVLNRCLNAWLMQIDTNEGAKKLSSSVRWNIDVDPIDLF